MKPLPLKCLESWSQELISRADRVRQLIGDAHWLSDGRHKENLLKQFLQRHLPPHLRIDPGFISPPDTTRKLSGEIDILITDPCWGPAFFAESGITIVPPESVVAHVHVKSEFRFANLKDVFESIRSAYSAISSSVDAHSVWSAGFFFSDAKATEPKRCLEWCRKIIADAPRVARFALPSCIAVLGQTILLFERRPSKPLLIRAFDHGNLAPAIMLTELFAHLEHTTHSAPREAGLFRIIERSGIKCVEALELSI